MGKRRLTITFDTEDGAQMEAYEFCKRLGRKTVSYITKVTTMTRASYGDIEPRTLEGILQVMDIYGIGMKQAATSTPPASLSHSAPRKERKKVAPKAERERGAPEPKPLPPLKDKAKADPKPLPPLAGKPVDLPPDDRKEDGGFVDIFDSENLDLLQEINDKVLEQGGIQV